MNKINKRRKEIDKNTPTKPGLYWGKKDDSYGRYNMLVDVYGKLPYLRWNSWNTETHEVLYGNSEPDFIFGDEIIQPTENNELNPALVNNCKTMTKEIESEYIGVLEEEHERFKNDNFRLKSELNSLLVKLNRDYKQIENCRHDTCWGKRQVYTEVIERLNAIINESVTII